jgi:hypothetical protein
VIASSFDSGAVYYPTLIGIPVVFGIVLAWRKPDRRAIWILIAAVGAVILFDFAFDETRFEDLPFFVVLGLFMVGLGLLVRWIASKVIGPRQAQTV